MPASAAPARAGRRNGNRQAPPAAMIPFTAAAHEHTEPAFDVTVTPGASAVQLGPFDVPAYGYLRHIKLEVTASGGTLGAGVITADFPWNLFQSIQLLDVNGAPIYGPLDGYAALWSNIVGGYAGRADPRAVPWYDATINADFPLRLPVEISHRDGFGALANQNAAAAYKVSLVVNPSATLFSTAPTTVPAFRIRGFLEAWSLPNDRNVAGAPQQQLPPVHGTSQYWSSFFRDTSAGANTVLLPRVGNLIRNVVVIARTAAGVRDDTVFPDPVELVWDARSMLRDTQNGRTQYLTERIPDLVTRDTGVFAFALDHSDHNQGGDDSPQLWYPTVQSTRLELDGSSVTAGRLQVMTNDVAPAEVTPQERFVETSETGFHPQVGVAGPAVQ